MAYGGPGTCNVSIQYSGKWNFPLDTIEIMDKLSVDFPTQPVLVVSTNQPVLSPLYQVSRYQVSQYQVSQYFIIKFLVFSSKEEDSTVLLV